LLHTALVQQQTVTKLSLALGQQRQEQPTPSQPTHSPWEQKLGHCWKNKCRKMKSGMGCPFKAKSWFNPHAHLQQSSEKGLINYTSEPKHISLCPGDHPLVQHTHKPDCYRGMTITCDVCGSNIALPNAY